MKSQFVISKARTTLIGITLLVALGYGSKALFPADAKPFSSATLIDAEWENCLRHHIEKRFFNLIDARQDQQKALDDLFKNRMEESRPTREKLREGLVELAKLYASSDASDEEIEAKAKDLRTMHEKLSQERLATALKVRKILDADQKRLLSERLLSRLSEHPSSGVLKGF